MHGHDRHQENHSQRKTDQWDVRAKEDGETAKEFESDGHPRHQVWRWNPEPLKRRSKVIRPIRNLGVAVRDEAVAHDQPQGKRRPAATF
jgi:hypothetical protein